MLRLQSGHKDKNLGRADSFSSSSQIVARKEQNWRTILSGAYTHSDISLKSWSQLLSSYVSFIHKIFSIFFVYCIYIFWLYHTLENKFPMNHTFWVKWNFFSFALHSWWGHKESDMTYELNHTPFFGFQIELWVLAVEYLVNEVTYTSCDKCRSHSSLSLCIHRLIHISFILIWLSCPACVRLFILPSHNHTYFLLIIWLPFCTLLWAH